MSLVSENIGCMQIFATVPLGGGGGGGVRRADHKFRQRRRVRKSGGGGATGAAQGSGSNNNANGDSSSDSLMPPRPKRKHRRPARYCNLIRSTRDGGNLDAGLSVDNDFMSVFLAQAGIESLLQAHSNSDRVREITASTEVVGDHFLDTGVPPLGGVPGGRSHKRLILISPLLSLIHI